MYLRIGDIRLSRRGRDGVSGAPADCGPLYTWTRTPGCSGPPPLTAEASRALPVRHYVLPEGWRQEHAICIATAGARATGKRLYIGVLVKQLELLCERLGVSMEPVTASPYKEYSTNYETPLYVQRWVDPADADRTHAGLLAA